MPSYPLDLPDARFASVRLFADQAQTYVESPFSFQGQVQDWGGARWRAEISLPRLRHTPAQSWQSFLLRLNGMVGTFLMGDPRTCRARGVGGGVPVVDGAGQTGATLNLRGAPTATVGWLLTGDYVQLGDGATSRLHKVLTSVDTDSSGGATLEIWPELRASPVDGDLITIDNPRGMWRLAEPGGAWVSGSSGFYDMSFSAVEALP